MPDVVQVPVRVVKGGSVSALVDAEDAARVLELGWALTPKGYAVSKVDGRTVGMHRVVMGLSYGDGWEVDHRDADRLNNRRSNLRVCTRAENGQNRRGGYGVSRHRGVAWQKARGCWQAYGAVDGQQTHLGLFADEQDAADAAAAWRAEHMPFSTEAAAA